MKNSAIKLLAVLLFLGFASTTIAAQAGATGRTRGGTTSSYTLTINTTPSNATIALNGRDQRSNRLNLDQGTYTVQVSAEGYQTQTIEVELNRNRTLDINLSRSLHRLRVNSNVSGADVYIDGNSVGSTAYDAELQPGAYRVEVRASGYESSETEVNLDRDRSLNLRLERSTFDLSISSNVSNAEVFVDGNRVGTTDYSGSFAQGSYSIRVTAAGYRDFISRVNLTSDQSLTANLQPQNGSVILDFPTRTANVFYYIDGDRMPVNVRQSREELSLSPGVYSFKFSAGGIESEEIDITIEAGRTLRLQPTLSFEITD